MNCCISQTELWIHSFLKNTVYSGFLPWKFKEKILLLIKIIKNDLQFWKNDKIRTMIVFLSIQVFTPHFFYLISTKSYIYIKQNLLQDCQWLQTECQVKMQFACAYLQKKFTPKDANELCNGTCLRVPWNHPWYHINENLIGKL